MQRNLRVKYVPHDFINNLKTHPSALTEWNLWMETKQNPSIQSIKAFTVESDLLQRYCCVLSIYTTEQRGILSPALFASSFGLHLKHFHNATQTHSGTSHVYDSVNSDLQSRGQIWLKMASTAGGNRRESYYPCPPSWGDEASCLYWGHQAWELKDKSWST